ncbi:methyl-accepting chemotaxis protein [Anabaena sp. PCC 7938]|uniref:methyl-accepting chemotaxis protein n=1 Tax=Anabaena sp. PCC 7938 TaxID=1296340 RepID=UPI001DE24BA2|nr:methyl-accepting chemotaxis protein [Anabaena sp. CCAP 1446/1C]MBY5282839.1 HAMP domain-containing protein [Anabaena sp. CCAP 1446/1C]MBY5306923.1 HAMP domain-containing protein [Anabaena sp. CCAP 1446/1C]MCM2407977.1 methyl-accepting chemotaxis protein [Anabaena sp. CCAP 1446/1C]
MVVNIDDHNSKYQQAVKAYTEGDYEVAATLVDQVVQNLPDDPNSHLLRGHIYYVLQQFEIAKTEYEQVSHLTDDEEIIGSATSYLENINQYLQSFGGGELLIDNDEPINSREMSNGLVANDAELLDLGVAGDFDDSNFDLQSFGEYQPSDNALKDISQDNLFDSHLGDLEFDQIPNNVMAFGDDPFALDQPLKGADANGISDNGELGAFDLPLTLEPIPSIDSGEASGALELPPFWQEDISTGNIGNSGENNPFAEIEVNSAQEFSGIKDEQTNSHFGEINNWERTPELLMEQDSSDFEDISVGNFDFANHNSEEINTVKNWEHTPELLMEQDSSDFENTSMGNFDFDNHSSEEINVGIYDEQEIPNNLIKNDFRDSTEHTYLSGLDNSLSQIPEEIETAQESNLNTEISSSWNSNFERRNESINLNTKQKQDNFDDDNFDLEAFESAFGSEGFPDDEDIHSISSISRGENSKNNIQFLDDFDDFDDLGNIPSFDLTGSSSYSDVDSLSQSQGIRSTNSHNFGGTNSHSFGGTNSHSFNEETDNSIDRDEELFSITGAQEAVPVFTESDASKLEPSVSVEQGLFAFFENASLETKQLWIAGTVGFTSAMVAAVINFGAMQISPAEHRVSVRNTGWAMAVAAGIAGGATAGFMGNLTLKQIRRTTKDLQTQFDAVREGNLNVQATVYSEDELGYLATSFNDMSRVIFTTTNEAQRKAVEQEEAKENLQRQVIRLLDDVEGAARGDLTVQAEVTADVLGAVADAFNLTIQNLRDIVQQVKVAAREVTKGSTNSETFARALSGDALRQAEELAVTLNSVQVMTESIQQVAVAAKEAETVARDASTIALKGGEAVENTVAGILEIRETVAETTRKVKRLAESSQEINSIVALVSQIASRTNLLALNASIEAARAGDAGRGFAIVADEVRQLADKSAKSLKEIEQIVMQIQSETSSVMTAMEEGTQQVIQGTRLAEEAKRSLENIIQVADHIDRLVRSITSDTVEQTETSRAVAQVMQSVELTAQETSQEAQRVSGALQHLVGVSRDLIASVERFRVETIESR